MLGAEVFIGAKVLIDGDPDEPILGFVFAHDGSYDGGSPWRVAIMDDCGVYHNYHYYDKTDLTVIGDFGRCYDEDHPLRFFWEKYYRGHYDWQSFVWVYNSDHGSKHDHLEGGDTLDKVDQE